MELCEPILQTHTVRLYFALVSVNKITFMIHIIYGIDAQEIRIVENKKFEVM